MSDLRRGFARLDASRDRHAIIGSLEYGHSSKLSGQCEPEYYLTLEFPRWLARTVGNEQIGMTTGITSHRLMCSQFVAGVMGGADRGIPAWNGDCRRDGRRRAFLGTSL